MTMTVNAQIEQDVDGFTVHFDVDGHNVSGAGRFKTRQEALAAVVGFRKALDFVDDMTPKFRMGTVD